MPAIKGRHALSTCIFLIYTEENLLHNIPKPKARRLVQLATSAEWPSSTRQKNSLSRIAGVFLHGGFTLRIRGLSKGYQQGFRRSCSIYIRGGLLSRGSTIIFMQGSASYSSFMQLNFPGRKIKLIELLGGGFEQATC